MPTPTEGYLVLEPDSPTAWEVIYYTSKTGSAVVCPSTGAGRGLGGSTAASHSQNATVRMDTTAELFLTLQDATALTGLHRYGTDGVWFDFVASACVWSADSPGSTRAASMTSGVVYINGRRHTVVAVTSHTFTASKDTYIDLLYSTIDNIATVVYTEVSNNAVSPALASNSIRIGIIITGASSIANSGSVNQGQETMVLPIVSSVAYSVTDGLGNLICPRDPNRKLLGYRQAISGNTTTSTSGVAIPALSVPVLIPLGRKIEINVVGPAIYNDTAGKRADFTLWDGVAITGTKLQRYAGPAGGGTFVETGLNMGWVGTPTATSKIYSVGFAATNSGGAFFEASSTEPIYIEIKLA